MADDKNAREIFLAALEREPAERAAYLDQACAGADEVRRRVDALLRAHDEPGAFLSEVAGGAAAHPSAAEHEGWPTRESEDGTVTFQPENAGTLIAGRYKLLQQIGEGGMGTVWMADQTEPVKRRVAVKVIRAERGQSKAILSRFEAERQAIALMDHPHIARLLDAGTSGSGAPYFVMELVKGVPLTDFCDAHKLGIPERLQIFTQVCAAVQHAHQKGVIHRDLKPSNILVESHDGKPVPKIIDFGLAKATTGLRLTENTLFTLFGSVMGTPLYMAPEQANFNALDVDTRADIYALGIILYELLTGTTPITRDTLNKAALDEMMRLIREQEAPRPSARLSATDSAPTVAANRQTEPAKLSKLMRGELDWIVLKSLEKDRNRRYETANGFAMDIQRYLADEAVLACPPSAGYRLRKFARRNKAALAVASVIAATVLFAVGTVGYMVRDRAAERTQRMTRVASQVEVILQEVDQLEKQQKWPEALAAARRAGAAVAGGEADAETTERVRARLKDLEFIDRLERVRMQRSTLVEGKHDDAGANRDYGGAFRDYGVDVDALPVEASIDRLKARPALAIPLAAALDDWVSSRSAIAKEDAATWKRLVAIARGIDPEPLRDRLRSTWGRPHADVRDDLRRLADSIDVRTQHPATLVMLAWTLQRVIDPDAALRMLRDAQYAHSGDYWVNAVLAYMLSEQKDHEGAIRFYTAAAAIQPRAAAAQNHLGLALRQQKKLDEALACYKQAIQLDPKDWGAYINLGNLLWQDLRDYGKAEEAFRKAIELDRTGTNKGAFTAYFNLGHHLSDQKKWDGAIASYKKAIELDPKYAPTHRSLGMALQEQKKLDEAVACYKKAIELDPKYVPAHNCLGLVLKEQKKLDEAVACYKKAIQLDPKDSIPQYNHGNVLREQKRLPEALDAFRKAIELDAKYVKAYIGLGYVLSDQKKLPEALAAYHKAIDIDPKDAGAYIGLGYVLRDQKKLPEALAAYNKAIELDPKGANAYYSLGSVLVEQNKLPEAISAYRKAIELDPKLAAAYGDLGNALRHQHKLDEAIAAFRKAIELDPNYALAHNNLGALLCDDLRDYRKAEEAFRKAIELEPKDAGGYFNLGNALLPQNKLDEAIAAYKKAIELDSKYAAPYFSLGNVLRAQNKLPEAIAALRKAIELNPANHRTYERLGLALRINAQPDEAIAAYRKAIELNPKYTAAYIELGVVLSQQKKLPEAIVAYRKAIELDPKNAIAHFNLGLDLRHQNKLDEAIAAYRKAIELDPKFALAHNNLGIALALQMKLDEAIACWRKTIELDPTYAYAHYNLGKALRAQNKLDEAIACFQKTVELNPDYFPALNNLADMLANHPDPKRRDPPEAVRLAKRAVERAPTAGYLWNTLGQAQYRAGDWQAAVVALEKSMKLRTGGDSNEFYFMAMAQWKLDQKDDARKWYDKAVEWMEKNQPMNAELRRFRFEAAELLGIEKKRN